MSAKPTKGWTLLAGTSTLRTWWSSYHCINTRPASQRKAINLFGRSAGYCATPAYDGFIALEVALHETGYSGVQSVWIPRPCPTGIAGKPCQKDGTNCSLHNYGIAIDIDPFAYGNPHFNAAFGDGWDFDDIKFTRPQVDAVEAIENEQGEAMFRWLGWSIGDTMHFEYQVPPGRCEVNWSTVTGDPMALTKEEEAFVRHLKAQYDDASTNPQFADEFAEAQAAGIYSDATKPGDVWFASKAAVFLKRAGALPVPPQTDGVTLTQVRSEISATKLTPRK